MSDNPQDARIPVWGWVLIIIALTMMVWLVVHALGTGGGRR